MKPGVVEKARRENDRRELKHIAGELEGWRRDAVLAAIGRLDELEQQLKTERWANRKVIEGLTR